MRWILLCSILVLFSCKHDTKTETVEKTETKSSKEITETKAAEKAAAVAIGRLPRICDHINSAFISSITGITEDAMTIKTNQTGSGGSALGCFFKWEDPNVANAGTMVQVMTNPIPDEAPNFHEMFIKGKKINGEIDPQTGETVKYKDFPGYGDDGAYSSELSKYIFRDGNDYSYMIAFNTDWDDAKELKMAKKIAQQIVDGLGIK